MWVFIIRFLSLAIYLYLLTDVGNKIFDIYKRFKGGKPVSQEVKKMQQAGWLIGILERLLMAMAVLLKEYNVFTGVIGLKAIARYHELSVGKDEERASKAEYFLIGSLFSILWTLLITALYIYIDRISGLNFVAFLKSAVT